MAAKKKAPKPAAPVVPEPQQLTNGQFVMAAFRETEQQLRQVKDPEQRKPLADRLAAMKAKFKDLPKTKVTKERAERYMAEVQKVSLDIRTAARG